MSALQTVVFTLATWGAVGVVPVIARRFDGRLVVRAAERITRTAARQRELLLHRLATAAQDPQDPTPEWSSR